MSLHDETREVEHRGKKSYGLEQNQLAFSSISLIILILLIIYIKSLNIIKYSMIVETKFLLTYCIFHFTITYLLT